MQYTIPVRTRHIPVQPRPAPIRAWLIGGALLMILMAVSTTTALGFGALIIYSSGRILPGVSSLGISLGGLTVSDAATALSDSWAGFRVRDGDRAWAASPADLGLRLDIQSTALAAQDEGRGSGSPISLLLGKGQVQPIVSVDLAQAEKGLKALAAAVERPAANATIRFINGNLTPIPASAGRQLNVAATLDRLHANAAGELADGSLDLVMSSVAPTVTDASPLLDRARHLLASPLTINAYNPISDKTDAWSLPAQHWGQWLSVENTAAGVNFSLDRSALGNFLNGQNPKLGEGHHIDVGQSVAAIQKAVSANSTTATIRVYNAPTVYTVQPGDTLGSIAWKVGAPMWRITKANPGVNTDALSGGQRITIPSKDDLLPLPIIQGKRIVISIAKQHMWVYENGALKWDWVASTGISDSPTMPGVFQVQSHEKNAYGALWDLWMPNFMGIYEAVPGFMNGIHGLPTLSSGRLLWAGFLGRPITYGCILLSLENGAAIYNWAQDGVVVEIQK